jgi:kynurenine 3-monooxygenase
MLYHVLGQVTSPWFLLQRRVEAWLHYAVPKRIIPLYSMVSFTEIPYSEALRRWRQQVRLVNWTIAGAGVLAATAVGVTALAWARRRAAAP